MGLYINPTGGAGYLAGSLEGSTYPSIGMFDLAGSLYTVPVTDSTGIAPAALAEHVWSSDDSDSAGYDYRSCDPYYYEVYGKNSSVLSGNFENGGTLKANPSDAYHHRVYYDDIRLYDLWPSGLSYGSENTVTAALIDGTGHRTLPWGIIGQHVVGTMDNPGTTWTARIGGQANFGAYRIGQEFHGRYAYPDGSYSYGYNTNTQTGYAFYFRQGTADYYKDYYSDGTFSGYDYLNQISLSGVWKEGTTEIRDVLAAPPDSGKATEVYAGTGVPDRGYWLASLSDGSADEGTLTGIFSGRLISSTLSGSINTKLQGVQDAEGKSFVVIGGGTWQGEPLKSFSPVNVFAASSVPIHSGSYSFSDGGYDYSYSIFSREGHTFYDRNGKSTATHYYPDGTTYAATDDYFSGTRGVTYGTWDPDALDLSSLASNPNQGGTISASAEDYYDAGISSWGSLYLGGTTSLWYDGSAIPVTKNGIPCGGGVIPSFRTGLGYLRALRLWRVSFLHRNGDVLVGLYRGKRLRLHLRRILACGNNRRHMVRQPASGSGERPLPDHHNTGRSEGRTAGDL